VCKRQGSKFLSTPYLRPKPTHIDFAVRSKLDSQFYFITIPLFIPRIINNVAGAIFKIYDDGIASSAVRCDFDGRVCLKRN